MSGRAFVFGDDIDTDMLAPGQYMKFGVDEIARHCLEMVDPNFAREVRPGDLVVAGRNFGAGSSREQAASALRHLGVVAVVAQSFAGLFYRNALNVGLPVLVSADTAQIRAGDRVAFDLDGSRIDNLTTGAQVKCEPIPAFLLEMVRAGGLLAHLERRLGRAQVAQ
jgi:3-isopropylmalate/(R)-2-methylmalate dehydratase small subunit